MAGNTQRFAGGAITGINVTPLVDITLVLLIIFMVTAKLIVSHAALTVDLPKAAHGDDVQEIFSVVLTSAGPAQVNGATLANDEEVLARAQRARVDNAGLRAVINADAAVSHGRVMHVLDLLKESGVSRIAFGVVPAQRRSPEGTL